MDLEALRSYHACIQARIGGINAPPTLPSNLVKSIADSRTGNAHPNFNYLAVHIEA